MIHHYISHRGVSPRSLGDTHHSRIHIINVPSFVDLIGLDSVFVNLNYIAILFCGGVGGKGGYNVCLLCHFGLVSHLLNLI